MNDPTKYAAESKAAFWGDRSKGQLVVFWKEYDGDYIESVDFNVEEWE